MYLVFDVGATYVKYAWMTLEGSIEEKGKIPTRNKKMRVLTIFYCL